MERRSASARPAALPKDCLPSRWDPEPPSKPPVAVFLPRTRPPAATVICACRLAPTSHSRTSEGSAFPSSHKCLCSFLTHFLRAQTPLTNVGVVDAGPPLTCQAWHSEAAELRDPLLNPVPLIFARSYLAPLFVVEWFQPGFMNPACAPKEESSLTLQAGSSYHRCSTA